MSEQDSKSKVVLFLSIGVVIVLSVLAGWWVLSPRWQPLMGADQPEGVRAETIAMLSQWQVPFREDVSSGEILIRAADVATVRRRLGEVGLPARDAVGLELFQDAGLGMSEFAQRINYQRALEGEISRTLRSFLDVRAARVHLTMPRESIFKDRREAAKASIVVAMRPEQALTANQVRGVQSLVSAAVENLSAENVIVLDEQGAVLSRSTLDGGVSSASANGEAIDAYEKKARELLFGLTGGVDFRVAISVQVNNDRVRSVQEKLLTPSESDSGYVVKRKETTAINAESSADGRAVAPGQRTTDEEFLFSKETSEIEYATGEVERVSVGIVVMSVLSDARVTEIEKVIAGGLGLDFLRGDRVEVIGIAPPPVEAEAQTAGIPAVVQESSEAPAALIGRLLGTQKSVAVTSGLVGLLVGAMFTLLLFGRLRRSPRSQSGENRVYLLAEAKAWLNESHSDAGKSERVFDV